jgi:hypothetical protein
MSTIKIKLINAVVHVYMIIIDTKANYIVRKSTPSHPLITCTIIPPSNAVVNPASNISYRPVFLQFFS